MPDDDELEPPQEPWDLGIALGLRESDRGLLTFALQQSYEQLRRRETDLPQEIEVLKQRLTVAYYGNMDHAPDLAERAIKAARDLGLIQTAIDKYEELNYRFPFINGAQFFMDPEDK